MEGDTLLAFYVDLDGTLVHGDTSAECFVRFVLSRPLAILEVLTWLQDGRARVKHELAVRVDVGTSTLPFNHVFLERLRARQAAGAGELIIASGAHFSIVQAVADACGFDAILASDAQVNRVGKAKLRSIEERQAGLPFAYAGNAGVDLTVYAAAAECWVVNPAPGLTRELRSQNRDFTLIEDRRSLPARVAATFGGPWLFALGVFTFAAGTGSGADLGMSLVGALGATAVTGGAAVIRGFRDLAVDRTHPVRSEIGIAAAEIHPGIAFAVGIGLGAAGFVLAMGAGFGTMLATVGLGVATINAGAHRRYPWWLTATLRPGLAAIAGLLLG